MAATRFQMVFTVHSMQLVLERAKRHVTNPHAASDGELQDLIKAIDKVLLEAEKITPLMR